jgi:hypothetical protein
MLLIALYMEISDALCINKNIAIRRCYRGQRRPRTATGRQDRSIEADGADKPNSKEGTVGQPAGNVR